MRRYFVYIPASKSRRLYVGVTNNVLLRVREHRAGGVEFTARYRIYRMVYVEVTEDIRAAIRREKQIKGRVRSRKVELIEATNPTWTDLAAAWNEPPLPRRPTADPSLRSG